MKTVTIEKTDLIENMFDSPFGRHYLVVSPDGTAKIIWAENDRYWDPWGDDDYTAAVPAIFPDGSGDEYQLVKEIAKVNGVDTAKLEEEDISLIEYVQEHYPGEYKARVDELTDWLVQAFEDACNGNTIDLGYNPWGYEWSESGPEDIWPDFEIKVA